MPEILSSAVWIWGVVAGLFAFLNSVASSASKRALYEFIVAKSTEVTRLPDVAEGLFERIFGPKHFSVRCVLASLAASLLFIFLFYILRVILTLFVYRNAHDFAEQYLNYIRLELVYPFQQPLIVSFSVSVGFNLVFDFFGLLKTRLMIRILKKARLSLALGLVLVTFDFAISFLLFQAFYVLLYLVSVFVNFGSGNTFLPAGDPYALLPTIEVMILLSFLRPIYPAGTFYKFLIKSHAVQILLLATLLPLFLTAVFFYASIAPSIWLWLFLLAAATSRVVAPIAPWAVRALDFEQNPIRTLGYVLATALAVCWLALLGIWSLFNFWMAHQT